MPMDCTCWIGMMGSMTDSDWKCSIGIILLSLSLQTCHIALPVPGRPKSERGSQCACPHHSLNCHLRSALRSNTRTPLQTAYSGSIGHVSRQSHISLSDRHQKGGGDGTSAASADPGVYGFASSHQKPERHMIGSGAAPPAPIHPRAMR